VYHPRAPNTALGVGCHRPKLPSHAPNRASDWMYEQPSRVLTHRRQIIVEGHPVQAFHGDVSELHPKLVSAAAGKERLGRRPR
jgi:hypothetical protein